MTRQISSIYLEAKERLLRDPSFHTFLIDTGLYIDYLEAAGILSEFYREYLLDNDTYLMKRISQLSRVRIFVIRMISSYLSYVGKDERYISNVVSAINNYVAVIHSQIDLAYEQLATKSRGEKAQEGLKRRILSFIGKLLEFYKICLLEDFDKAIDSILIEKRFIDEYIKRAVSPAAKLKQIEEELGEEELLSEQVVESLEKEAFDKELELESMRELLFEDKEIKLIKTLIENNAIDRDIFINNVRGILKLKSKSEVRKLAESINAKVMARYKYPIIHIKDKELIRLDGRNFDAIKNSLQVVHPELVALFERYYKKKIEK